MTASTSIDFALRVCESIAFTLHAILGLTEPCTGCLRNVAFGDAHHVLPVWAWPVGGLSLLCVACANFSLSDTIVLAAQLYIVAFHIGAGLYHVKLGHHPAVGLAPGIFVVFAMVVTALRTNVLVAMVFFVGGTAAALVGSRLLLKSNTHEDGSAIQGPLLSA